MTHDPTDNFTPEAFAEEAFEIAAHPQHAATARERVRDAAVRAGFDRMALGDIEVAVGEAVTNAILYGSPSDGSPVHIATHFSPADAVFHVEVRDRGQGFNPDHLKQDASDTDALGGRGVRLMRALMDSVLLRYDGTGMVVKLSKRRGP